MLLKIYAIYDRVAAEYGFTFKAKNDEMMKRVMMSALQDNQPNIVNTDTDDKDVFLIGTYETVTAEIVPTYPGEFVIHLSEIRQELLAKIKAAKLAAGVDVPEEGIEK